MLEVVLTNDSTVTGLSRTNANHNYQIYEEMQNSVNDFVVQCASVEIKVLPIIS